MISENKKILVTGGAGFIGSHFVDRLIEDGHQVVVLDNLSTGVKENLDSKAKFYQIDICDPKISDIFEKEKPQIVFHFAAQINVRKSVDDPMEDARVNVLGGINILENCKKFKVEKVIFTSTGGAIYGEADVVPTPENYPEFPLSPYGIAKLSTEKYLNYYYKNFGLPFTVLRLANVYGPRQNSKSEAGVVAIFCGNILSKGSPLIFGDGNQTRDFIYVKDIVEAGVLAMDSQQVDIFNIGTGKETSINAIFNEINKLAGSDCKEVYLPAKLGEQKRSCLDYAKAKNKLNWDPKFDLEGGLAETLKWFKQNES